MPRITTNVLHTSVEKCSASASSASLGYFFATRLRERARTKSTPMHRARISNRREAWANLHAVEEQALKRFPDDVERGEEQQTGLDKRGKAFHLVVAVRVLCVGGLFRDANRKVRDDRGDQVQNRVQRFGENAQAARHRRQENFQKHEQHRRADRSERRQAFFTIRAFVWFWHCPGDYTLWRVAGRGARRRNLCAWAVSNNFRDCARPPKSGVWHTSCTM